MEILFALITVLLLLSFLLKSTFLPRWGVGVAALLMALTVRLVIPFLASQPAETVNGWIFSPDRVLDIAVCIVLEALLMMAFCFSRTLSRFRFLRWYPGLLAFPAVCWAWGQLLYSSAGIHFTRFAIWAALGTLVVILGGSWGLRRLLPEEDIRLEGLFLIQLFLLLLTIAATGVITF